MIRIGLSIALAYSVQQTNQQEEREMNLRIGSKVTGQPSKWYDGQPVKNWPDPYYIATVVKFDNLYHTTTPSHAWVKYDVTGRKEIINCSDRLFEQVS
jgi:hypothetical protein